MNDVEFIFKYEQLKRRAAEAGFEIGLGADGLILSHEPCEVRTDVSTMDEAYSYLRGWQAAINSAFAEAPETTIHY